MSYEKLLLKEGMADFEIDTIADRDSQGNLYMSKSSGDRMIKANLHVIDSEGDVDALWVNIVHEHLYRLRDLCEAVGMPQVYKDYKRGILCLKELVGKEGRCELVIKHDNNYGSKNEIKKFIFKKRAPQEIVAQANQEHGDVPF